MIINLILGEQESIVELDTGETVVVTNNEPVIKPTEQDLGQSQSE